MVSKRVVGLVEHCARRRERFGEGPSHADLLRPLSRKDECTHHRAAPSNASPSAPEGAAKR